jgi:hypothetical protein
MVYPNGLPLNHECKSPVKPALWQAGICEINRNYYRSVPVPMKSFSAVFQITKAEILEIK